MLDPSSGFLITFITSDAASLFGEIDYSSDLSILNNSMCDCSIMLIIILENVTMD